MCSAAFRKATYLKLTHRSINLQHWTFSCMVLTRQPRAADPVLSLKERLVPDTAWPPEPPKQLTEARASWSWANPQLEAQRMGGIPSPPPCAAAIARFQVSGGNLYFLAATSWLKPAFPGHCVFQGKSHLLFPSSRGHAFCRATAQVCKDRWTNTVFHSQLLQSFIYTEEAQNNQWQTTRSVL